MTTVNACFSLCPLQRWSEVSCKGLRENPKSDRETINSAIRCLKTLLDPYSLSEHCLIHVLSRNRLLDLVNKNYAVLVSTNSRGLKKAASETEQNVAKKISFQETRKKCCCLWLDPLG